MKQKIGIVLSVLWYGIITLFSHFPGQESSIQSAWVIGWFQEMGLITDPEDFSEVGFWIRKLAHFSLYAVLTFCLNLSGLRLRWVIISLIILASVDEFHQSFIPGRTGTYKDVIIDCLGGIFMLLFIKWKVIRQSSCKIYRSYL
jgi:VanZ family protein